MERNKFKTALVVGWGPTEGSGLYGLSRALQWLGTGGWVGLI